MHPPDSVMPIGIAIGGLGLARQGERLKAEDTHNKPLTCRILKPPGIMFTASLGAGSLAHLALRPGSRLLHGFRMSDWS